MAHNLPAEILRAEQRIRPYILKTPLIPSLPIGQMGGATVYLKMESEQYTNSFKARGAMNKVLSLTNEERTQGIVTASTGNHAQGTARACSLTGTVTLVCVRLAGTSKSTSGSNSTNS
ncbi:MAG TPA: pyridoxal-phosphate dependent enzyme [candidate division Zixibacteria bacterium]|nr:pyridoxal-phosphate dependent enzyme [candidate division Zixibacteria bacterium]